MTNKPYKNQLIYELSNQKISFQTYKGNLGKDFIYVLLEISKIFKFQIEYWKLVKLEISLVRNIENLKHWKKVFYKFAFISFDCFFWENIATFLYCSWVIKKIKINNFLSFYEQKRRNAFNKITVSLMNEENDFNIKVLAMLKKWK